MTDRGCACRRVPEPEHKWCERCGAPYCPRACLPCTAEMTKQDLAEAAHINHNEGHRALDYLWTAIQAAGVKTGDIAKAYVTVREALNERQETPR